MEVGIYLMDKNRSSKPAAGGVARSDPDNPHRYKMPAAAKLSVNDEKALGLKIQSANRAIEVLETSIWSKINPYLDGLDLSPFSPDDVKPMAREELTKVIKSMAASQPNAGAFAAGLRRSLCDRLAAYVESHCELVGLLHQLDQWMATHLPEAGLLRSVPPWTAHDKRLWSIASARDAAINRLVETHMLLAQQMAKAAMRRKDELYDLMNEAALILHRRAESFDPDAGTRFSSHAYTALLELKRRCPSNETTRYTARQVQATPADAEPASSGPPSIDQADPLSAAFTTAKTRLAIENARRLLAPGSRSSIDPPDRQCHSPSDLAELREHMERLRPALGRLSWLERKVLIGKKICGQSFRAMGTRYRKSPNTISKIYDEARRKLACDLDPDSLSPNPR
jgi:RNA polymerase sigma factor (sigma-70 family)